tara:strand:- start:5731 stop:6201 length:471 start_codon:yes stop_codon:yes gene_type:complete
MKTIITTLVVLIALTVNAQDFKSVTLLSKINGPIMLDSIEKPNILPSDVLWEENVTFKFDIENENLIVSTHGEIKSYKIEKTYKAKIFKREKYKYVSRGFSVEKLGIIVITVNVDLEDENESYFSVQVEREYNENFERKWFVDLYYVSQKDAKFIK